VLIAREVIRSLWVGHDIKERVGITLDLEIEPPSAIHPCLPNVTSLIVLFRPKRWVIEVHQKKSARRSKARFTAGGASR
jgi:hypothetical protein